MSNKKFLISLVSVFTFTYIVDFFLHNSFLKLAYQSTANLWRPESEMSTLLHLSVIVHLIFAIIVMQFFKEFVFSKKKHLLHDSLGAGLLIGEMVGLIADDQVFVMQIRISRSSFNGNWEGHVNHVTRAP